MKKTTIQNEIDRYVESVEASNRVEAFCDAARHLIRAGASKPISFELRGEATIEAASGDGKGPRKFSMMAYNGEPFRPHVDPPIDHPVIVDLATLKAARKQITVLKDHDRKMHVGHTTAVSTDGQLLAEGVISGGSAAAKEVLEAADNGYAWPISMGADFQSKFEFVERGKSVRVNGKSAAGPVYVARHGQLKELSFLTIAADDSAVALIAAEAAEQDEVMDFKSWLKANGFPVEDKLTGSRLIVLRAQFKACGGIKLEDANKTTLQATLDAIEEPEPASTVQAGEGDDYAADIKAEVAAMRREGEVYRLCGTHTEIGQKAIAGKWTDEQIQQAIEVKELRASLPRNVSIHSNRPKDAPAEGAVLEAAIARTGNLSNIDKVFDERTLHEAAIRYPSGIDLHDVLMTGAQAHGYRGHGLKNDIGGVLSHAFGLAAAGQFSTISLPGVFANSANKFMLEGYTGVDGSWRAIADVRPLKDFKPTTSWRLTGANGFEELPADGEIAHGTLGEESYELQLKTYAKMYGITRKMIIDDDMSALTSIPRKLGRDAALGLNTIFWADFLDHATFFTSGNGNYVSGAGTALSIAAITTALTEFRRQTDTDGNPLAITPAILLVPPELEATALAIMATMNINTGGAATDAQVPNVNIYAGRFRVVVTPYLTDTAEWYLIANPADVPVIAVGFLNGRQQPTIEQEASDFNTLGVLFRGYFDFGVGKQDFRGGVKANGT